MRMISILVTSVAALAASASAQDSFGGAPAQQQPQPQQQSQQQQMPQPMQQLPGGLWRARANGWPQFCQRATHGDPGLWRCGD